MVRRSPNLFSTRGMRVSNAGDMHENILFWRIDSAESIQKLIFMMYRFFVLSFVFFVSFYPICLLSNIWSQTRSSDKDGVCVKRVVCVGVCGIDENKSHEFQMIAKRKKKKQFTSGNIW